MKPLAMSGKISEGPPCGAFIVESAKDPFRRAGLWCGPYHDSPAVDLWSLCVAEVVADAEAAETFQTVANLILDIAEVTS